MSLRNKPPVFPPVWIGVCLGMILSVPFAAFLARLAADNYDMRVLIYALTLLWCIIGVFTVLRVSKHVDIEPKLSISRVLRYVLMLWLWPALWLFTF